MGEMDLLVGPECVQPMSILGGELEKAGCSLSIEVFT